MNRNLFAVIAALALGVGTASAATPTTASSSQSLEQRVLAAQKVLGAATDITAPAVRARSDKVAQYYWNNWHNWSNYFHNY